MLLLSAPLAGHLGSRSFYQRVLAAKEPIVDLRTFADRNFAFWRPFPPFVLGIGLMASPIFIPIYLSAGARLRRADDRRDQFVLCQRREVMFLTAPIAQRRIAQGHRSTRHDALRLLRRFGLGTW